MNEPAQIVRLTTSDRVATEIRRMVWDGQLAGGERLNQVDLAARFGVSRIPVREALIALAHQGVVTMEAHRGAFVEPLTEDAVRDHYELFGQVDGFALRKAVERAGTSDRTDLASAMISAGTLDQPAAMQRAMVAIRARFHELGGSPRFRAVASGLVGLVVGDFFETIPGAIDVAADHLPAIGAGVQDVDATSAVDRYEAMLSAHGELVLGVLRAKGVLA